MLSGGGVAWLVSGRTGEALAGQAGRLAGWVAARPGLDPADVGWSLATTRAVFEHRAVVTGASAAELVAGLDAVAAGVPAAGVVTGAVPGGGRGRVVLVFPGQGGQWAGMGRELAAASPAFAVRLAQCGAALAPFTGWDLGGALAGDGLDRADVVQPALWAVMVSLAAVWEAAGIRPDAVVGHSQGEIAAAVVAGVLSLEDGARVVALRSRALRVLAGLGAMASVAEPAAAVRERIAAQDRIAGRDGRLSVAAVNGPAATVVSGDPAAVRELVAGYEQDGIRARVLAVDYASHCAQVDQIRADVLGALDGLSPRRGSIPVVSAMTGMPLDGLEMGAEYWYDSLRSPVEFEQAIRTLSEAGHRSFIEVSPHPVLAAAITETLDGTAAFAGGTLRRDDGGPARLLASLADAHVHGVPVDWTTVLPRGQRVALPSYAFQHQRYWPAPPAAPAGEPAALGLAPGGHPLLGAVVQLAGGDGIILTGRISAAAQPWLADHTVHGTMVVPGTVLADLAVRAADLAGCRSVAELVLEAPLVLPGGGAVQVQVTVGGPAGDGTRDVAIWARPDGGDAPWTRHAAGRLSPAAAALAAGPDAWPPPGAEPVPADGLYAALAAAGYGYGPAFQGVRAAWQLGRDVYADIALPDGISAAGYAVHPALLDAALHPAQASGQRAGDSSAVRVDRPDRARRRRHRAAGPAGPRPGREPVPARHRPGRRPGHHDRRARHPRHRPRPPRRCPGRRRAVHHHLDARPGACQAPARRWTVLGHDAALIAALARAGQHVTAYAGPATPASLTTALAAAAPDGTAAGPDFVLAPVPARPGAPAQAARAATAATLNLIQHWLAATPPPRARLVITTAGAVPATPADHITDLPGAAAWGLARTAQTEHPGQIILADLPDPADATRLPAATTTTEPQLAIRAHTTYAPRLTRPDAAAENGTQQVGTALITGGTGLLGGLVARHLAATGRIGGAVLTSRSAAARGAAALAAAVATAGAWVRVVACDAADRSALATLLAARHLSMVVHAAGVLDDATITSLTPARADAVMRPKADAAWHLHELTEAMDLDQFVLFSSGAAVFGSAGQGSYAAANAFLDALAAHRRVRGLPGISLAWGLWADASAMTGHLSADDRARIGRAGMTALTADEGLRLLDTALGRAEALLVPARLDVAGLRSWSSRGADVPALLRGLAGPPARQTVSGTGTDAARSLWQQLTSLPGPDRTRMLVNLVRGHAAAVLGHSSPESVDTSRAFRELGFDSLTAVELRNRLATATGLQLPGHARLRLPSTDSAGRAPARATAGHRQRSGDDDDPGHHRCGRRADRYRRDGLPVPRRCPGAGRPVAAAGQRLRRDR